MREYGGVMVSWLWAFREWEISSQMRVREGAGWGIHVFMMWVRLGDKLENESRRKLWRIF